MIKKALFILLFLSVFPLKVFAQQDGEVVINGQIFDQQNTPIPGAVVIFNDKVGKTIEEVKADAEGVYEALIPQGTYAITADGPEGAEFISTTLNNKEIFSSEEINFRLTSALPDRKSITSPTNLVFYGLIGVVLLGVLGFAVFLYVKSARLKR